MSVWKFCAPAAARRAPEPSLAAGLVAARLVATGLARTLPRRECAANLFAPELEAPFGDPPQRLADNGAAHLALAPFTLSEGDGHLDDAKAAPQRAPGQVHLEAVTL